MLKALFLDLDGTLLNSKYKITKKNKDAIKEIIKNKWKVFIITGKSFHIAKKYADILEIKTPLITSQGQVIIDTDCNILKLYKQTFKNINPIFKELLNKNKLKNWTAETLDAFWVKSKNNNNTLKLINNNNKPIYEVHDNNKDQLHKEELIGVFFDIENTSKKETLSLIKSLRQKYNDQQFQYWDTDHELTTITIQSKTFNKWSAIKYIKDKFNIDFIVTIGNGYSDKEMLSKANIGIAMKNSSDKVKSYATYVSKYDHNHSGVAYEINKLLENKGL